MAIDDAYLMDGFPTIIGFSLGSYHLYERTLDPIGYSMGGAIGVETMRNEAFRTQSPKSLVSVLAAGVKTAYLPTEIPLIINDIGENQTIAIVWPTGTSVTFWGWIEEFKPETLEEGKFPLADVKIEVSNLNNSGVETGPVWA